MPRFTLVLSAPLPLAMAMDTKAQSPAGSPTKVHKIAIGGDGGWDYLTADAEAMQTKSWSSTVDPCAS